MESLITHLLSHWFVTTLFALTLVGVVLHRYESLWNLASDNPQLGDSSGLKTELLNKPEVEHEGFGRCFRLGLLTVLATIFASLISGHPMRLAGETLIDTIAASDRMKLAYSGLSALALVVVPKAFIAPGDISKRNKLAIFLLVTGWVAWFLCFIFFWIVPDLPEAFGIVLFSAVIAMTSPKSALMFVMMYGTGAILPDSVPGIAMSFVLLFGSAAALLAMHFGPQRIRHNPVILPLIVVFVLLGILVIATFSSPGRYASPDKPMFLLTMLLPLSLTLSFHLSHLLGNRGSSIRTSGHRLRQKLWVGIATCIATGLFLWTYLHLLRSSDGTRIFALSSLFSGQSGTLQDYWWMSVLLATSFFPIVFRALRVVKPLPLRTGESFH